MSRITGFISSSLRQSHQSRWRIDRLVCAGLLVVAACTAPPAPLPSTPVPPTPVAPAPLPELDVRELVLAERAASIAGDEANLAALWLEDATISDGRSTADLADDYVWHGREAILDRYRLAVFPAPPPPMTALDLAGAIVELHGDDATLQNRGDHWRLTKRDGQWRLAALHYN